MIIYFSATGNCKYTANKIAEATDDIAVSMTDIDEVLLNNDEQLGIVTPTYFWGLPTYVNDFLKKVKIQNADKSYIYCVATYGTTSGQVDYFVNEHLKNKGLHLSASYGIKTVDNWTVWFNVKDERKTKKMLENEKVQIEKAIKNIKGRNNVFIKKDKMPMFLCRKAKYFYDKARRTFHLRVNEKCISCGLCAKNCPINAIEMIDRKPKWVTDKCVMCLKCLHTCPEFAIQYDNKTQKNGQYMHP